MPASSLSFRIVLPTSASSVVTSLTLSSQSQRLRLAIDHFRHRTGVERGAHIQREGSGGFIGMYAMGSGSAAQIAEVRVGRQSHNLVAYAVIAPELPAQHRLRLRSTVWRMRD